jgi:hypothetical protein
MYVCVCMCMCVCIYIYIYILLILIYLFIYFLFILFIELCNWRRTAPYKISLSCTMTIKIILFYSNCCVYDNNHLELCYIELCYTTGLYCIMLCHSTWLYYITLQHMFISFYMTFHALSFLLVPINCVHQQCPEAEEWAHGRRTTATMRKVLSTNLAKVWNTYLSVGSPAPSTTAEHLGLSESQY